MEALIDCDVLLYECSAVGELDDEVSSFDYVKEVFDGKVRDIVAAVEADSYTLYVTGKGNFRFDIAVTKPYKGTRKAEKPFHYENLRAYALSLPQAVLVEGMEADDAMSIEQSENTIICTRDKDLRMVEGWHYGWETGMQAGFAKQQVDKHGALSITEGKNKKLRGTGMMFFYSQLLTGDTVDNILGLKGCGPVKAYDLLHECKTEEELFKVVQGAYEEKHGDEWRVHMLEMGRLLWMVRELDSEGKPVMWDIPTMGDSDGSKSTED